MAILVMGPVLGVFLYFALFQFLRLSTTLVKIVATLGLSVVFPPLATVIFGNVTIIKAPGLAPQPVKVYKVDGVPVTTDELIVYASVLIIVVVGALDTALHGHRPEGSGDGRLPRDDVSVGGRTPCRCRSGCGR